jgi:hypothetical protein
MYTLLKRQQDYFSLLRSSFLKAYCKIFKVLRRCLRVA